MHATNRLFPADLLDPPATAGAVAGSDIAYRTVGLPIDSTVRERRFPVMMAITMAACEKHGTKLVFFDNIFMYPRISAPRYENTRFQPVGRKAPVCARVADMLNAEIRAGRIEAVICRAHEFYGPGKTKSLTNSAVFERIREIIVRAAGWLNPAIKEDSELMLHYRDDNIFDSSRFAAGSLHFRVTTLPRGYRRDPLTICSERDSSVA